MTLATHPSPADRLATLIEALCTAIAAHGARGFLTAPLQLLLWSRLRRMAVRARRLAPWIAAGAPPAIPRPPRPRRAPSAPYLRLPRGVAWLVRVVPGTASGAATLQFLLDDPEMAAVANSPPMRRLLRPLCRMLGVPPPLLPKRPAATPAPPPPPTVRQGEPAHPSETTPPGLPPPLGVALARGPDQSRVEGDICPA